MLLACISLAFTNPVYAAPDRHTEGPQTIKCGNTGKIIGAILGGVAGFAVAKLLRVKGAGIVVIAALAGAGGLAVGKEIDDRRCRLKKLAKLNKLDMTVEEIPAIVSVDPAEPGTPSKAPSAGLSVTVRDDGTQFATNSDQLTPAAATYFAQIAEMYSFERQRATLGANPSDERKQMTETLRNKIVLLVGHTDDTGSAEFNAALSERRARTVAALFAAHGVPAAQIYYQGAGEALPVADNNNDEGRAKNRRVEIIDLPDAAALVAYLGTRATDPTHYRPVAEIARPAATPPPPRLAANPPTPRRTPPKSSPAPRATIPVPKPRAAAAARPPRPSRSSAADIDFGGAASVFLVPNIGAATVAGRDKSQQPRTVAACNLDRPHVAYAVRSLGNGSSLAYSTADYMPGLYGTSWFGNVNGQLVSLTHVTVLRDGGMPVSPPELLIYRDWRAGRGAGAKASVRAKPQINVYRGKSGLLYRVFTSGAANLRCIDVVLPPGGGAAAPSSQLYYSYSGEVRRADYKARLAR